MTARYDIATLKTRLGEVTLPEHPALSAGIFLLGEP